VAVTTLALRRAPRETDIRNNQGIKGKAKIEVKVTLFWEGGEEKRVSLY
jgi:hypothetical protein